MDNIKILKDFLFYVFNVKIEINCDIFCCCKIIKNNFLIYFRGIMYVFKFE